jgi:hypothetical protein
MDERLVDVWFNYGANSPFWNGDANRAEGWYWGDGWGMNGPFPTRLAAESASRPAPLHESGNEAKS